MADTANQFGMWQPWLPDEATSFFSTLAAPWWIAGGWAIDLFLGTQTRTHEDMDILVLRRDQDAVRMLLHGWDVQEAHPELLPCAWPFQEWRLGTPLPASVHDIWCRPHEHAPWTFQLMITDTDATNTIDDQWIFRRNAQIRGTLAAMGRKTTQGIPYLAPEIQLLYKSKGLRSKDEADFASVLPALDMESQRWLAHSLTLVHPGHPWLAKLV